MGLFDGAIDEQKLTDGLTVLVNRLLTRIEDEILATKKLVVTIELVDKEK